MPESNEREQPYGLGSRGNTESTEAPDLPYRPRDPETYHPSIGLIACGGITEHHLRAYKGAGYHVVALCDVVPERAEKRRAEFYPDAEVYTDYRDVLRREDIEVVDVAAHPEERIGILEDAIRARKHILSQKPFVLDLDIGQRLVDLADEHGVKLAVNQNGRWAPHFSYMRHAVQAGIIGDVSSVRLAVHWDHNWTAGTDFENIKHLILYDFGIHWFDILTCFMGGRVPERVYASVARTASQKIRPPLLAQVLVEFEGAQAGLLFHGDVRHGVRDQSFIAGSDGSLFSSGPDLNEQNVTLHTDEGCASPDLEGTWFLDGFHGTMSELLCAIDEDREPTNGARSNLESLALCFAAVASADSGQPVVPGTVRRMPGD